VADLALGLVITVHVAYLVYSAVGGFLALRDLRWLWPHLISTAWSIIVTVTPIGCPLTAMEKAILVADGRSPYDGSFTEFYFRDVIYPAQYEVAVWLSMMGLAVLSYVLVYRRYRPRRAGASAHPEPGRVGSSAHP
jgi:hypothetical protein